MTKCKCPFCCINIQEKDKIKPCDKCKLRMDILNIIVKKWNDDLPEKKLIGLEVFIIES